MEYLRCIILSEIMSHLKLSIDSLAHHAHLHRHIAALPLESVCWFKHELAITKSTQYIWLEKISKLIYLPSQLSAGNDLASCALTYHVLPVCYVSLKSFKQFRRSCTYEINQVYFIRKNLSWIISPYSCQLVMILLRVHLYIMYYHWYKFHWKTPSGLRGVALTRCDGQTDRKLNHLP